MNGLESIWIIGDEFASNSCDEYFKRTCNTTLKGKKDTGTHCGDFFEIKTHTANQYTSHIHNFIGWVLNTFTQALNNEEFLPKAVVFILDNDLIKFVNIASFGISVIYGRIIHYMCDEIMKLLTSKKEKLPKRATRDQFPHVIWIVPPFHSFFTDNPQCAKLGKALDNTVVLFKNMWSLKLKKIWDSQDSTLYVKDSHRFTVTGLMTYWMAVDRTIKFWDTSLINPPTLKPNHNPPKTFNNNKDFHRRRKWHNPSFQKQRTYNNEQKSFN